MQKPVAFLEKMAPYLAIGSGLGLAARYGYERYKKDKENQLNGR